MSDVSPILKTTVFTASLETLFDAYTDPEHLEKWFAERATIDISENGAWRYEFGDGLAAEGHVLEAVRPSRFIWTWEKSITPDENGVDQVYESETVNTYVFDAVDGGTQFRIEESNHESQEMRDMSEGGIDHMLTTLKAYVEDGIVIDWTQSPEM